MKRNCRDHIWLMILFEAMGLAWGGAGGSTDRDPAAASQRKRESIPSHRLMLWQSRMLHALWGFSTVSFVCSSRWRLLQDPAVGPQLLCRSPPAADTDHTARSHRHHECDNARPSRFSGEDANCDSRSRKRRHGLLQVRWGG
eukprot:3141074-Rhodomonas_salina.1